MAHLAVPAVALCPGCYGGPPAWLIPVLIGVAVVLAFAVMRVRNAQRALLVVVVLFLALFTVLTVRDMVDNGVTPLDVVALLLIGFFATALINALIQPPPED